jgi:hypothetical protein
MMIGRIRSAPDDWPRGLAGCDDGEAVGETFVDDGVGATVMTESDIASEIRSDDSGRTSCGTLADDDEVCSAWGVFSMTSSMVLRGSVCEGDVESGVELADDDDEGRRGIADA